MKDKYNKIIYSYMNNDYIYKLCEYISNNYFTKQGKILDVGCGTGNHMNMFNKLGYDIHGIDIRESGNKKTKRCNIEYDKFPYKDNSFDYIFSKSVIEHIHRPDNFLQECKRVLKKGGILVIMTPEWKSQMSFFWDDYSHYHPWTRKSLRDALKIFGFKDVECDIFIQLPFIWKYPYLKFITYLISIIPDRFKWKTKEMRNGEDRKLIRFSKEKMLIGVGTK
jgi:ubiquinone/menaquinone biosynthesis C-methylase UbiE